MNYILFDDNCWYNLLPLTFTRPVSEVRVGILTIKEKWNKFLNSSCSYKTIDYLSEKYKLVLSDENCFINSSVLPDINIITEINSLKSNQCLIKGDILLAVKLFLKESQEFNYSDFRDNDVVHYKNEFLKINFPYDIFLKNGISINSDFELITKNRKSFELSKTNNILCPENIFIEEGVKAEFTTLNAANGKIYIGKNAEIMEGSIIRGPFALCNDSVLKLGTKIYGPTTIGPFSKVGGEVNNSVIFGYSNKAHDGFIGNSVIGEWCNLGAGSNNSNLKNNYSEIKIWNYPSEKFLKTGLYFCGLIMGDHTKCGINTMFNTGTIAGVSSNIFGSGFPRNFIQSFSWGGAEGFTTYTLEKALEVAEKVMERRNIKLDAIDKKILGHVFELTEKYKGKS